MASLSSMSDDERWAGHLHYEVDRLIDYATELCKAYPPEGDPGPDGFTDSPAEDAMREAALVHLRLLDGFLGGGRSFPDDLNATEWLSAWSPQGFLNGRQRSAMNKHVAHLDKNRRSYRDWEIGTLTIECLAALERFLNVAAQPPGTLPRALDPTLRRVRDGLADLRALRSSK